MTLHRRNPRRDGNESEIVNALRAAGCSVQHLSGRGVPDLLVGLCGHTMLVEVKTRKGRATMDQEAWKMRWNGGTVFVARSVEDALAWVQRWKVALGLDQTRTVSR